MSTEEWTEGIAFMPEGRAWVFPEKNVVFTRTFGRRATAADAHALIELFLWLPGQIDPSGPPVVIHDWRSFDALSREARAAFLARRAEIRLRPERLFVAVTLNPVYRMALRTAALAAQMMTQAVSIKLVDDPFAVLARLGVGAPDAALHLRLREAFRQRGVSAG